MVETTETTTPPNSRGLVGELQRADRLNCFVYQALVC